MWRRGIAPSPHGFVMRQIFPSFWHPPSLLTAIAAPGSLFIIIIALSCPPPTFPTLDPQLIHGKTLPRAFPPLQTRNFRLQTGFLLM